MKSLKKLIVEEVIDEGIPYLVVISKKSLPKLIRRQLQKLGFRLEGRSWFLEKPDSMDRIAEKLERIGYRMHLMTVPPAKAKGKFRSIGRNLLKLYFKRKKKLMLVQGELEKTAGKLRKLVRKLGAHRKPGTDDSLLAIDDYRVHYQFVTGRRTWGKEDFGIQWLRNHGNKSALRSVVDREEWDKLKSSGVIPLEIVRKVEARSEPHYTLVVKKASELICPSCSADIKSKDKFCSDCGHRLKDLK